MYFPELVEYACDIAGDQAAARRIVGMDLQSGLTLPELTERLFHGLLAGG